MAALLAQSYFYPAAPGTGFGRFLPPGAREYLARPADVAQGMGKELGYSRASAAVAEAVPTGVITGKERLQDLLSAHLSSGSSGGGAEGSQGTKPQPSLIVRADPSGHDVSVSEYHHTHDGVEGRPADETVSRWDELTEEQKARYKARLVQAGRWVEEEGEKVLKGMLWSSYAGLVGQAAGELLREL